MNCHKDVQEMDEQLAQLARILLDQRRAAIAVVERTEAALAAVGAPVESAIRTREERRAQLVEHAEDEQPQQSEQADENA